MSDMMEFPETVEEFMEEYKIVDRDEVYTNGAELVPIFRMEQWFKHLKAKKTTHVIKIQGQYADAVADGRKTFEVRWNDRGYNAGDEVVFKVTENIFHPLNDKKYEITYVHSGLGMDDGYVVFGIKEIKDDN